MTRVDQLPESTVVNQIKDLQQFAEQIKNRQITAGASLLFFLSGNPDTVYFSGPITDPGTAPGTYVRNVTINFTAAHQDNVFADLIPQMYIGDLNTPYDYKTHYYDPLLAGSGSYFGMIIYTVPGSVTNERLASWTVSLDTNDNVTPIYFKLRVVGTDEPA